MRVSMEQGQDKDFNDRYWKRSVRVGMKLEQDRELEEGTGRGR